MKKQPQNGRSLAVTSRNITKRRFCSTKFGSPDDWEVLRRYRTKLAVVDGAREGISVSAKALHKALGSKRDFTNWCKYRIEQTGAVEGTDYLLAKFVAQVRSKNGVKQSREMVDYRLTPDMAKHWSMMEGTPTGMLVRKYFLLCEKVAKGSVEFNLLRANALSEDDCRMKHELAKRGCPEKAEVVHREVCEVVTGAPPHRWKEATGKAPRDAMSLTDLARYIAGFKFAVDMLAAGQKWYSEVRPMLEKVYANIVSAAAYGVIVARDGVQSKSGISRR